MASLLGSPNGYSPHMKSLFAHRHTADNKYDSVCLQCYQTIATEGTERELDKAERIHLCPPIQVSYREKSLRTAN